MLYAGWERRKVEGGEGERREREAVGVYFFPFAGGVVVLCWTLRKYSSTLGQSRDFFLQGGGGLAGIVEPGKPHSAFLFPHEEGRNLG